MACIETLKRRKRGIVRQVPLPDDLLHELDRTSRLRRCQRDPRVAIGRRWSWSRTSAWRRVKAIMGKAGIFGAPAMRRVTEPMLNEVWRDALRTMAIYADVMVPTNEPLPHVCGSLRARGPDSMPSKLKG